MGPKCNHTCLHESGEGDFAIGREKAHGPGAETGGLQHEPRKASSFQRRQGLDLPSSRREAQPTLWLQPGDAGFEFLTYGNVKK